MLVEAQKSILWLGQAGCDDVRVTGGKVANLSRLAAEYRVPPGFCVTTYAYRYADSQMLPAELCDEVAAAYRSLGEWRGISNPAVAVRSSAVDEDGSHASFAGQHETYLNISGIDAVLDAIRRCWASAHDERVLEYRRQQGLSLDTIRLAVLVQQLVIADVAAVVFSANPVTSNRDEIVVNASWGLGESIAGGTVTPDTYVVDKQTMCLARQIVAEKRRMTVAVPGGTQEVDVPRLLRSQPALTGQQAVGMASLARSLEQRMGFPVDVECALHTEQLYLLQCRPITTLR